MDLFGKKALSALQSRLDEVEQALRQALAERDRLASDLQRHTQDLLSARGEVEDLKRRLQEAEARAARSREALAQAEKMVAWVSDKEAKALAEVENLRRERDDAMRQADRLETELREVRAMLEQARRTAREKVEANAGPSRPPRTSQTDAEEIAKLRKENEQLRRMNAEQGERLRVALRKAEHNRRAWLVTQMQLDLAEDRLYLLTHGTPRPVLVTRQVPSGTNPGQRMEAVEVEGMEEVGEEADGSSPPVARAEGTSKDEG